jgi:hypothetical protein
MNPSIENSPNNWNPPIIEQNAEELGLQVPETGSNPEQSIAEQVGLVDDQFDVQRNNGDIEKGWKVAGIGTDTDKDTGLERQFVIIEKPALDSNGMPMLDELGKPVIESQKDIWTDKLMSWQQSDQNEDEDTREAELALEEVGGIAVDATTEVDELEITEPNDDIEQLADEEVTTEPSVETSLVEDTSEKSNEILEGPAAKELEKVKDAFVDTANNFNGIHATMESLPVTVGRLTEAFVQTQGQYLDQVGGNLSNVKALVEPLRNMAPLLRSLEEDLHGTIDQRTRQELQIVVDNAHQALRGLAGLVDVASNGKRTVDGTQRDLADQITHMARQAEVAVESFESEAKGRIDNSVYEGHQKVSEAKMEGTEDSSGAIMRDRDNLDHFDYDLNQVTNMSRNVQEATFVLGNSATRQLDYDFTGAVLNSHGLNPMSIDDAYANMSSFVRTLESISSQSSGSKGNVLAELQPIVNTRLSEALSIIDRMRRPSTEYADQNSALSKLRNNSKDALAQSDRLASYLKSVKREIEDGVRG